MSSNEFRACSPPGEGINKMCAWVIASPLQGNLMEKKRFTLKIKNEPIAFFLVFIQEQNLEAETQIRKYSSNRIAMN